MSVVKALTKLLLLLALIAAVAGIAVLLKRPKGAENVSFDEWPDVTRNPDAA